MKREIGGQRLGSGKKMEVSLRTYERSTHDLGYLWRSSMASGTLVPFINEIGLPGDTFDIDLDAEVRTHPTLGPLFGSYKLQLDVFETPVRLYNAQLHNNELGIGMNMDQVMFPLYKISSPNNTPNENSLQIEPSCLWSYLGVRGIGANADFAAEYVARDFNAMPLLIYWDIFKNYYANKQETFAYAISSTPAAIDVVANIKNGDGSKTLPETVGDIPIETTEGLVVTFNATTVITEANISVIKIQTSAGPQLQPDQLFRTITIIDSGGPTPQIVCTDPLVTTAMVYWVYVNSGQPTVVPPRLESFLLSNIDDMRTNLLRADYGVPYYVSDVPQEPYSLMQGVQEGISPLMSSQQGLAVKTYQSDINNNWMATTWQNQISQQTAISTAGDQFTIDQLNLSKKVYDMLNRIAISGGTYDDWIQTVYTAENITRAETPMYCGGLSKEILFQEVVAMANSTTPNGGNQYLGQQGGKGIMGKKHKGGKIVIKCKEPVIIMGIVSITPRVDYSQGNKWHMNLLNMNDLHKPALDEIGFQDLITDQMAYFDTGIIGTQHPVFRSAGLQPAWINYMTNVNQTYGNFALLDNEMFMTLNRRYEGNFATGRLTDLTTYIDPTKYNFIFAQTSIDAQNFWTQISVNITTRRKMSAKVMPNL